VLLAEQLNWPLYGVVISDHMFCRWDEGKDCYRTNIDAVTLGRSSPPDWFYEQDYGATKEEIKNSIYMKNLSKKQMIGQFFYARAMHWEAMGDLDNAIADIRRAMNLTGKDPFMGKFLARVKMKQNQHYREVSEKELLYYANKNLEPPSLDAEPRVPTPGGPRVRNPTPRRMGMGRHPAMDDPLYYTRQ